MKNLVTIQEESVPALGLGTYGLQGYEGEEAILFAIEMGYRHIDTAQFYRNEEAVGKAIKRSGIARNEFFITTKVWQSEFIKSRFIPSVVNSLRQLKVDYADLLLLHWPSDDHTNDLALDLLQECHNKNYTRFTGVSNFDMKQLKRAQQKIKVFCNQIEYNPFTDRREILKYMQDSDILLTAYTPLARGRVCSNPVIISIAKKYNVTPTQVALQWLLRQKNVAAIPKSGGTKHLKENLGALDFELSEKDAVLIENIRN